jgi:hypothetical protein
MAPQVPGRAGRCGAEPRAWACRHRAQHSLACRAPSRARVERRRVSSGPVGLATCRRGDAGHASQQGHLGDGPGLVVRIYSEWPVCTSSDYMLEARKLNAVVKHELRVIAGIFNVQQRHWQLAIGTDGRPYCAVSGPAPLASRVRRRRSCIRLRTISQLRALEATPSRRRTTLHRCSNNSPGRRRPDGVDRTR